jgi:hypothetical protein
MKVPTTKRICKDASSIWRSKVSRGAGGRFKGAEGLARRQGVGGRGPRAFAGLECERARVSRAGVMVKTQTHVITYSHPFAAVTSSLWSKYDNHKYVRNVEIIDRHIDAMGRLHSMRLLSMGGSLPAFLQPFVPVKLVHMLETVVVDPAAQTMTVETSNISCQSVLDARSRSRYTPSPDSPDSTKYEINIAVRAFPPADHSESAATSNDSAEHASSHRSSTRGTGAVYTQSDTSHGTAASTEWTLEIVTGQFSAAGAEDSILSRWQQGYIAGRMESWAVNKLLTNVNKGEKYIDGFCRRWRERHTMHCDYAGAHTSAESDLPGAREATIASSPKVASDEGFTRQRLASRCEGSFSAHSVDGCSTRETREGGGALTGGGLKDAVARQRRFSRLLSKQVALFMDTSQQPADMGS